MSGSFESVRWNACVHRLDLDLYSYPKEFWGIGVRNRVNSNGKIPWVGVKNFGFTEEQKNIEQGSIKLKELHVCISVFKRRWRLGGRKCRKSDICVCRKAKVVELHIVCMLK